jgi:retron-type reverse transcriptase
MQDCIVWAFEFLYQCEASKEELILKLYFAKAFDSIDHSTMLKIMSHMGFDNKWMKWTEQIFSSRKSAVLLNGVPVDSFRQGDPLSPLLLS